MSLKLTDRIRKRQVKIGVIGLGHVGLPVAAIFADAGFSVIGSDINKNLITAISSLRLVTQEMELDNLIRRVVRTGRLRVVADNVSASMQADVVLICVQTPLTDTREPNLRFLEKASRDVAKGLAAGKLVVIVSTVPPGATRNLVARILEQESGLKCDSDFGLAYCPERILPGNTLQEFKSNARVVGGVSLQSTQSTVELFKSVVKGKIWVTDIANAELAKLAENTFRYVNIAFANELALLCEKVGADIVEVVNLANTHPRVNIHKPGPGIGGPCLTKDPQLLLHSVGHSIFKSKIIRYCEELNDNMPEHTLKLVIKALNDKDKDISHSCVAVLGVAYKAEVSDTTNSPARKIIYNLLQLGAQVRVYDPYATEGFGANRTRSLKDAVKGADCILIATDHKIFAHLPYKEIKMLMNENPVIVDARRVLDPKNAKNEGFEYWGIGLGTRNGDWSRREY
jgi:UDP-N-acetyl-D-mannosaminuronic acid dehydrogenase